MALAYTEDDHLFVATRQAINEHDASDPSKLISSYEVDPSDNKIKSLQVSDLLVSFTTESKHMFIYQRK